MTSNANLAGFLILDKPKGWTSADVVRKLKSAFGLGRRRIKIGHCGTLDPIATGVLPICIGAATRFSRFVIDGRKSYRANVTFGVETDTYDADGEVVATGDADSLTLTEIENALRQYSGEIDQVPPAYSAIKVRGRRMYSVARSGEAEELPSRRVTIHSLEVVSWDSPNLQVDISCSKGFYVRSLAHDLGRDLRCGAHLSALRRLRSGPFTIEEAVDLSNLLESAEGDAWLGALRPVASAVADLPSISLDNESGFAFSNGRQVAGAGRGWVAEARVYDGDGEFLGLGTCSDADDALSPSLVLPRSISSAQSCR